MNRYATADQKSLILHFFRKVDSSLHHIRQQLYTFIFRFQGVSLFINLKEKKSFVSTFYQIHEQENRW